MTKRDLNQRVEQPTASKLRLISQSLLALRVEGRASRLYINEISDAITNGMLLAAIELSTTLLEIWIRDLLVIRKLTSYKIQTKHELHRLLTKIDREIEGLNRGKMFSSMSKELLDLQVIDHEEFEWLERIYKHVRTPLHHGVSGRIIDPNGMSIRMLENAKTKEEMLVASIFGSTPHKRADRLEDYIYSSAPDTLEQVVNFLAAHQIPRIGI